MGPLHGITVVDLTQFLPGPMATLMLADAGARVIKIEPPGGDPARAMEPMEAGQSVWFRNLNRGKEARTLDLKAEAGKEALRALVAQADVFVESFRPGVMARLGFGWEALSALNPRLVYCSISAFGQTGSHAHHPAHDLVVEALSGFLSVNDGPDGAPVVPGVPAADMAAGFAAAAGIAMALVGRAVSGSGTYVDTSMLRAMLPWSAHIAGGALAGTAPPRSSEQRSLGGAAMYNVYRTADGLHVVLGGREMKFARMFLEALGRLDLLPLAEAPAGEPQAPLIAFFRETFAARTRDEWERWFEGRDIAFAPVLDFHESLAREPGAALVVEADGAHQFAPALAWPGWAPRPAPQQGG